MNSYGERLITLALAGLLVAAVPGAFANGQARGPRSGYDQNGGTWTVPDGTVINVKMDSTLNSRVSRPGDKFTATVTIPVYINGRTAIPAGSVIEGRVTQVTPAKRMSKSGTIAVDFDDIIFPNGSRQQLVGSLTAADPSDRRKIDEEGQVSGGSTAKRSAVFIGGGGAVGAILGGISGGAGGAALGGLIGAGTGVAGVMLQKGEEAEVRAGTPFGVRLNQPLVVEAGAGGDSAQGQQPDYDPNQDSSYPSGRPRITRQGADPDRSGDPDVSNPPQNSEPVTTQPSESGSGAVRSSRPDAAGPPPDSRSTEPDRTSTEPDTRSTAPEASQPAPAADLPLSSPEMVKRAQQALQDQGYYEGNIDGTMGSRTSNALRAYQHDHHIPETGDLDPATAKSLGIVGRSAAGTANNSGTGGTYQRGSNQPTGSSTSSPDYGRSSGSQDQAGSPSSSGDSSIAYPRRSQRTEQSDPGDSGPVYSGRGTGPDSPDASSGSGGTGGYGGRRNRRGTYDSSGSSNRPGVSYEAGDIGMARTIRQQAEELLAQYERMIGIQSNGQRGVQVERARYGDPEMELLFAFSNFANAAKLYSELSASIDSGSHRSLILALAREARRTDRVFTTSNSQAAQSLATRWDAIRQNVLRLMDSQNITAAEIEEK